jgi:class 3 adenylate cyclase
MHRDGDSFASSVNLAARLLRCRRPDELLASRAVAEATREQFVRKRRGSERVPGLSDPVETYRLVGRPANGSERRLIA